MNTAADRWFLVVNPESGRGRGRRALDALRRALERERIDARIALTEGPGHAGALALDAVSRGFERVAAVGGDGTAHETVGGLADALDADALRRLLLAIVPIGTGNDWARSLGVPTRLTAAAAMLARGEPGDCDLGLVECTTPRGPVRRHFVNVAGAGFDAYVVERLGARKPGRWAYLLELLRSHRRFAPPTLTLAAPGGPASAQALAVFATVGGYCGGGMRIAPEARLDDGLLDVTLIGAMSGTRILWELRRLFDASLHACPHVRAWTASELLIDAQPPCGVQADGELLGLTPARVRILPRAIRVVRRPDLPRYTSARTA